MVNTFLNDLQLKEGIYKLLQNQKSMKILFHSFLVISCLTFLASCGPTLSPFTEDLARDYNWSESDLKKIQFYLSEDVVIWRARRRGTSEITRGEIKIRDGREVEEIIFTKGTPGILLFIPKENRYAVSFEDNDNDLFLMFGPNPRADDKFVLLASDWDKKKGKITYGGEKYYTSADNAFACLMVDLTEFRRTDIDSRRAKGRRIE